MNCEHRIIWKPIDPEFIWHAPGGHKPYPLTIRQHPELSFNKPIRRDVHTNVITPLKTEMGAAHRVQRGDQRLIILWYTVLDGWQPDYHPGNFGRNTYPLDRRCLLRWQNRHHNAGDNHYQYQFVDHEANPLLILSDNDHSIPAQQGKGFTCVRS